MAGSCIQDDEFCLEDIMAKMYVHDRYYFRGLTRPADDPTHVMTSEELITQVLQDRPLEV